MNGRLAIAAVESGVRWNWDWPPWVTIAAALAATIWVVSIYAREQRFVSRRLRTALAALRLAALAVAVAMLAQPTIERRRVAPPRLALLADRSASMLTEDVPAGDVPAPTGAASGPPPDAISRREARDRLLTAGSRPLIDELRAAFNLTVVPFDAQAEAAAADFVSDSMELRKMLQPRDASGTNPAPSSANSGTHLGDAIDFALRGLGGPAPAAIVLLSDGVSTGGVPLTEAITRARLLGVPIYAVAIGSDRPQLDVAIDDVLAERVVFPGDRLEVEATVRAVGAAGRTVRIALENSVTKAPLAESQVTLPADGAAETVRLALRPTEPGQLRLRLAIDPLSGERDVANNEAELVIDVRSKPIRTLLVSSTPSFEYRALKSLLERDPAIELQVFLQDADADFPTAEAGAIGEFPANATALLEYDVLLLLDVDPTLVPQQAWPAVEEFVAVHGGGLGLVAGPRFLPEAFRDVAPMRTLLPIEIPSREATRAAAANVAGFAVQPTAAGMDSAAFQLGDAPQASAAIWAALPPVLWLLQSTQTKPGATVLAISPPPSDAGGQATPVIVRQYVGAGEVLMHLTDETWRWRWRNDDRYFARYWGQAVRRLARGRAIRGSGSLATNRATYRAGEPVTLRARLGAMSRLDADAVVVQLEAAHAATREIKLSRLASPPDAFEAVLRDMPADAYLARLGASVTGHATLTAEFTVQSPPGELTRLAVNSSGLREAAQLTGGRYYTAQTANRLLDELPAATPTAIEKLPDEPLWNSPWLMTALCLALGAEWLVRRRVGML